MTYAPTLLAWILATLVLTQEGYGASYTIVHPKMFRIDAEETVVINFYGYGSRGVTVTSQLADYPRRLNIFSAKTTPGNSNRPLSFTVKVSRSDVAHFQTIHNKKVEMQLTINGLTSTIRRNIIVHLTGETDYLFIQTDRPIYRPKENVQIRVVPLNLHMLPLKGTDDAVEIAVQTPGEHVAVKKWDKRFPAGAFIEVTFPIPDYPPLGIWRVTAKVNNTLHTTTRFTEFKVDKYVLPTYDVVISVEQSYIKPNDSIAVIFEAKYSYGEPVIGSFSISGFIHLPDTNERLEFYSKPSTYYKRPGLLLASDKGKKIFSMSTTKAAEVSGRSWEELVSIKATIAVRVSVLGFGHCHDKKKGEAEGLMESDEKRGILVTNSPYLIDMSHTSRYFIPRRTHPVTVMVRDVVTRDPVPNVQVLVRRDDVEAVTETTNERGTTQIVINTPRNSDTLNLMIKTQDPNLNEEHQASIDFELTKYTSHSDAYLRIEAPSNAKAGEPVYLKFFPYGIGHVEVQYLILAQGTIIHSGQKAVAGSEASEKVDITRKMSPGIRVVAYYMNGDEVVSDSVSIDIDDVCHSRELEINVDDDSRAVKPGGSVRFSIQGQGRALVGLSAADRAAYFLFDEGRLNRKKMFDQMRTFDQGCTMTGGSDGLDVFVGAGLSCTTNTRATPTVSVLECPHAEDSRKRRSAPSFSDLDPELQKVRRKCAIDGRFANLAGENCAIREQRVQNYGYPPEKQAICSKAFAEACAMGTFIRETMEFRQNTQRTGGLIDIHSTAANERRHLFQEAPLWRDDTLPHNGQLQETVTMPHGITTFDFDAISVHDTEGFCVAKPVEVKVFKDFFIQLYLPYSVKVMEQVQIKAALFNYHHTEDRKVSISIKGDENLCTQSTPGEPFDIGTFTVSSQSSVSFSFTVIPLRVPQDGLASIVVQSKPVSELDLSASDSIEKTLRIEEAGTMKEFSKSLVLDPSLSNPNRRIELNFPGDFVPDSRKCWIYGHMNFLGPIIEFDPIAETPKDLGQSITLPHGCGEQNMFSCGPNAFAFKYLQSQEHERAGIRNEIQRYIIDGYTRQQTHRNGGVWAVYSNRRPTIWLNAYVDKTFLHARSVWPEMEMQPICSSLAWLVEQQKPRGHFTEEMLAHYYTINVAVGGDDALTAYVIIAFSETEIPCHNRTISSARSNAAEYLHTTVNQEVNTYTAAIVAYALALVDPTHSNIIIAIERLMASKIEDGDEIHWSRSANVNRVAPIDIEMTAYALLALVTKARSVGSDVDESTVETINKIARWMVSQQNYKGGVQSSQTTVVAIQAITEYGIWIDGLEAPPRNPHLDVVLTAAGTSWRNGHMFSVDQRYEFYRKEEELPQDVLQGSRNITVSVSGEGKGRLSYRCIYRQTKNSDNCDFNITAITDMNGYVDPSGEGEAEPGKGKRVMKLKLTISKLSPPASSMGIIEVGFISGFRPIEKTLESLMVNEVVDGSIDRYEISDQKVIIYVEKFSVQNSAEQPLRIAFNFIQDVVVNSPNPAKIIVYDYYEPDVSCSKFYAVPDDSPMLRTSCAPASVDDTNRQQCKCVEGGCPHCRVREEQLEKTCGTRRICNNACRGQNCVNLHSTVCEKDFGYIAEITNITTEGMPQFVKLTAIVKEVIRTRTHDAELKTDELRTFVIRKDCYDGCHDDALKSSNDYFAVGRTFLIMGKQPEKLISDDETSFMYFLDHEAKIERTMTTDKCRKLRGKKQSVCGNPTSDKCIKRVNRIQICDNLDAMRLGVFEGCD